MIEAPLSDPAPGYPAEQRDAVYRVIAERRDVRQGFRPDPVPRGTGIDAAMYARKVEVVCRGLARHQPDPDDPVGSSRRSAVSSTPRWPRTRSPPASQATAVSSPDQ